MFTLIHDSDPLLHRRTALFNDWENAASFAEALIAGMHHFNAVGLAANQIGFDTRVCAVSIEAGDRVLFNPRVLNVGEECELAGEGCLSYPELYLDVNRPMSCRVVYQDEKGEARSLSVEGMDARIIQHEVDHLNGVTFVSHVSRLRLCMAKKKLAKHKK